MERFTSLYAIAYAILNGTENLRFDKEGYFYVLVFYMLFYKTNETRESLGEIEIAWKNPLQFLILPNFHTSLYLI